MPMSTEIVRNGKPVSLPWSGWLTNCLYEAMIKENGGDVQKYSDYPYGMPENVADEIKYYPYGYAFKERHVFHAFKWEIFLLADNPEEVMHIIVEPGDVYNCWRGGNP